MKPLRCTLTRQRGAAAVEFALTAIAFLALVIGAIEFSRLMLTWNMAVETTRLGARVAVVCDKNDTAIKRRMREMLPPLSDANIVVSYPTSGCTARSCEPVTVRIVNFDVPLVIPGIPLSFTLPSLATSLPSESLSSADNPLCD